MSISSLSAGLSGLHANQQALGVSAHNIANLNTGNFQGRQASFHEASPAGAGVTLSVAGRGMAAADGLSTADAAADIASALVYKAGFDLSAKVIQAADERLGTLIDLKA